MSLQERFLKFDNNIKISDSIKNTLREKRDVLIKILRNSEKLPNFNVLDQGSYSMHLGVESIDKEYDIDVGLRFVVNKDDYAPMEFKNIIYDILKDHTDYGSEIKKPCVTVKYKKSGALAYHVDLVSYAYEDKENSASQLYLSMGKNSCSPDEIVWEKSDPTGLIEYINDAINKGVERDQYRRIIRYIKRWKNLKFNSSGHIEPPSIGITLIAADKFEAKEQDDLETLILFVKKIKELFKVVEYKNGRYLYRIEYPMPSSLNFETKTNIFEKMTDSQMTDFKDKIEKLEKDLKAVKDDADEIEQCKKLQKIFGADFEIPNIKTVSKSQKNYIPFTSSSGSF